MTTTIAQEQRSVRRIIAGIAVAGGVALSSLVGTAVTAPAAEAAYVPVRWAHPVHGKRPMSFICWASGQRICKTEKLCWRGNPDIAYTRPSAQPLRCLTYKY